jgi:HlyD family secretion protein
LPHHPKRVIVLSLIVALAVGIFGYEIINKSVPTPIVKDNSNINIDSNPSLPQDLTLGFLAGGRIKSVSVKAGDHVFKGKILAALDAGNTEGALAQAKAAYETAKANYQKIINGATSTAIDVAKAAVNTAQVNLDGVTKQQNLLVTNARINFLNSTLTAKSRENNSLVPPSITGAYTKDTEGNIILKINQTGSGGYVSFSGIENGTTPASAASPQPIGDSGLYIDFSSISPYFGTSWEIDIPNTTAPNYLANYNAYQTALSAKTQMISNAKASLDQANASLTALVTAARPEDVATAQAQMDNALGAVQIAQAAYENTIITAPGNGTVVSVSISPGQIATPNAPAIQFISNSSTN